MMGLCANAVQMGDPSRCTESAKSAQKRPRLKRIGANGLRTFAVHRKRFAQFARRARPSHAAFRRMDQTKKWPIFAEHAAALKLDSLTKPIGSLGRLEEIVRRYAAIRHDASAAMGRPSPRSRRRPTSGCGVSDRYRCCIIRASSGATTSAWMCSES